MHPAIFVLSLPRNRLNLTFAAPNSGGKLGL